MKVQFGKLEVSHEAFVEGSEMSVPSFCLPTGGLAFPKLDAAGKVTSMWHLGLDGAMTTQAVAKGVVMLTEARWLFEPRGAPLSPAYDQYKSGRLLFEPHGKKWGIILRADTDGADYWDFSTGSPQWSNGMSTALYEAFALTAVSAKDPQHVLVTVTSGGD